MIIGIPKEIKTGERRVAITPHDAGSLVNQGHKVLVESTAGLGAGFTDYHYLEAGAEIVWSADELFELAQLIVKVKEPQEQELRLLKAHHLLFCYLHLGGLPQLTQALLQIGLTGVAFETVVKEGKTPLLAPMSAIAGRLAIQLGSCLLHSYQGGKGTLIGGTMQEHDGRVLVIGAGVAGTEAVALATRMGARVTLLDINPGKLEEARSRFPDLQIALSKADALEQILPETDLLVGAAYVVGKTAPKVISEDLMRLLPEGAVAVDIAIDQGGCFETSKPCTYKNPHYFWEHVLHSCVANMPAAVPATASKALSSAITPYLLELAQGQWSPELKLGLNVQGGKLLIELT